MLSCAVSHGLLNLHSTVTSVPGLHRGGPFCHAMMGVTGCAEGHSMSQLTYDLLMLKEKSAILLIV